MLTSQLGNGCLSLLENNKKDWLGMDLGSPSDYVHVANTTPTTKRE